MILVGVQGRSHFGTRPMVLTPSADQMGFSNLATLLSGVLAIVTTNGQLK